jgi:hypothetical protein
MADRRVNEGRAVNGKMTFLAEDTAAEMKGSAETIPRVLPGLCRQGFGRYRFDQRFRAQTRS